MLTLYIICFWVGLILTLVTTLFGGHGTHSIHIDTDLDTHSGSIHGHGHSPINVSTLLAFLTGFGGTGYLLVINNVFNGLLILLIALGIGLAVGALLFIFLSKVLMRDENVMKEMDYQLQGILGTITAAIPAHGIGEMKYVMGGTTRSIGAKDQHGNEIRKGAKVVILRQVKGIAEVTLFEE